MAAKSLHEYLEGNTRFGILTVLRDVGNLKGRRRIECRCDCGVIREFDGQHLKRGNSRSCGCEIVRGKPTHGQFYHPLYSRWNAMVQRCTNPKHKDFPLYGGRGISVCERWLADPANFFADMGDCPEGLSLDRGNPNGNYEPSNCRWATDETQAQNKRATRVFSFRGEKVCLAEACRRAGIKHRFSAVYKRISKGASFSDALAREGIIT